MCDDGGGDAKGKFRVFERLDFWGRTRGRR